MKKKVAISMMLALTMLVSSACAVKQGDTSTQSQSAATTTETEKVEEPVKEAEKAEDLKTVMEEDKIASGEPVRGGTVTTSCNYDPPPALNGNMWISRAWGGGELKDLSYERLFDYSAVPEPYYMPRLGISFETNENIMTVKIDPTRTWSDGEPITAEDIICTYQMQFMGGERLWKYLEKVEATDASTITFTFRQASPMFPIMAFNRVIDCRVKEYGPWAEQMAELIPQRTFDEAIGEFKNSDEIEAKISEVKEDCFKYLPEITDVPVNSGYKPSSVTASQVVFERNENYWNKDICYPDKIVAMSYSSSEAYLANVMKKAYDMEPHGVTPDIMEQIKSSIPEMRLVWTSDLGQPTFTYNHRKYPMDIKEVRKAVQYAVDRDTLLEIAEPGTLMYDKYNTGSSPLWRDAYGDAEFISTLEDYSYNPDKVAELLESIGWKKGSDGYYVDDKGQPVTIEISSMNSWPIYFVCGEAIMNMLNDVGLKATFNAMEISSYWQYIDTGSHQLAADFRGGSRYFGPWEIYRDIFYNTKSRAGFKTEADPVNMMLNYTLEDGTEVSIEKCLNDLFYVTSEESEIEAARLLMKLNNENCWLMPIGEKYAPMKIYNEKLAGFPADSNDPLWYGYGPTVINRLICTGHLYYVE